MVGLEKRNKCLKQLSDRAATRKHHVESDSFENFAKDPSLAQPCRERLGLGEFTSKVS